MTDQAPPMGKKSASTLRRLLIGLLLIAVTASIIVARHRLQPQVTTTTMSEPAVKSTTTPTPLTNTENFYLAQKQANRGDIDAAMSLLQIPATTPGPSQTTATIDIKLLKQYQQNTLNIQLQQLSDVIAAVSTLKPEPATALTQTTTSTKPQEKESWIKRTLLYPFRKISLMIIIKRNDAAPERLPSGTQVEMRRDELTRLATMTQLALLQNNPEGASILLKQFEQQLSKYFGGNPDAIAPLQKITQDLLSHRFSTPAPTLALPPPAGQ